ncbi:MAG: serine/threonine-protein kinase [Mycobacterium sp.]|uniref:serine/threonine-protein kinase n=1 Tax=Mycobacterium sp. TaxID=1785 RepID=UPI0026399D49|nr:serine/threonine-protein kinase [Mycobacterium sp.]MDI3313993.1 serine/threonine-protein kinase [Mycobacterium sp.]
MPLAIGTVFAGYTILRLLGSGGMGEVYLAQHPRLRRRDALKILPEALTADREFRERFHREADLVAELWHPNIVGMHDRGEFDGQLWIAMDYVEGTDAGQLMKAQYPAGMPPHDVSVIVTAVARALDYAHQRGLLHRDVKPANILLTEPEDGERRILLADFGVARQLADVSGLTATNMTVGTVAYCAPEQLMGLQLDGRADQYALAATAFHLLTGAPPYQHSNPVAVISQHLNAALPKLSDRRPELAHLDQVLSRALAKDPTDRFGRCREFAMRLSERTAGDAESDRPTQAGITVSARAVGSVQAERYSAKPQSTTTKSPPRSEDSLPSGPEPAAAKKQRRRRPILVGAAIAVAVLAAIGATLYVVERENHATTTPPIRTPAPPAAVLDGTYRMEFDLAKQTFNGAPAPAPNTGNTAWWAFRSACRPTGCVATGTELDVNNHDVAANPSDTVESHFVDGHWQVVPYQIPVQSPRCLGADGKSIVAGAYTEMVTWSLKPQPDGALRGVVTDTFLTNECGGQGLVRQVPLVATRMGDVPPSVTVADPATVTAPSTTSTAAPVVGGPGLDGTYRLDVDFAKQTENGDPVSGGTHETHWWAFRSLCTSAGCVAAGAALADENHQEATGAAKVLRFADGHWQDTPYLQPPHQCAGATNGNVAETDTISSSLDPQPDGTLRGVLTVTALTNECGDQGDVWQTPISATRVGDVPPSVVIADPALFVAPPAPAPGGPR